MIGSVTASHALLIRITTPANAGVSSTTSVRK